MVNLSKCSRLFFLIAYFSLGAISSAISQTTIQSPGFPTDQGINGANISSTFSIGQSFTPTTNGNITSISIKLLGSGIEMNTNTGNVNLLLGTDTGPNTIFPLTNPAYAVATVTTSNLTGVITFDLSATPFPVTSGTLYRMQFNSNTVSPNVIKLDMSSASNYTGGNVFDDIGATAVGLDLNFSITLSPPTTNVPIPTLSQWGLMIFALLILNLGLVLIQERVML